MSDLRGYTLTIIGQADLVTETCFKCGVLFAMTVDYRNHRLRSRDEFHCPNGHSQHYIGKTDTERLKEAEAREVALRDQLRAAVHEAEQVRIALLRDRQRFANGVCPCCNRSFENVARHMRSQHPDYDVTRVEQQAHTTFRCSCGRAFESLRGLRIHQGWSRREGWDKPSAPRWSAHLTKV